MWVNTVYGWPLLITNMSTILAHLASKLQNVTDNTMEKRGLKEKILGLQEKLSTSAVNWETKLIEMERNALRNRDRSVGSRLL